MLVKGYSKPEPLADERRRRREELREYRKAQYRLAIERDGGLCCTCGRVAVDVHHLYGRGRVAGDWRERHENLECVCRGCHPFGHK
jgi:5-methylcytosine-specific restriction endonuclease McrA